MDKSTVVIIDDHPVFRAGIIFIIHDDFKVIGQAGTAKEGFSLIQELKPDIAIIDILLPDYNGILLTQKIMKSPDMNVRVMMISAHSKMDYVKEAVQSGALGYVGLGSIFGQYMTRMDTDIHG